MRILVCGPRDMADLNKVITTLDMIHLRDGIDLVIEGEAPGTDTMARQWAEQNDIEIAPYPADWKRYGRGAGPIRNKQMLTEGQPDLVTAIADRPIDQTRGTKNMIKQARDAGYQTEVYD